MTLTVKKKVCTLIVKIPTLLQQSFVFSVGGAKVFFLQKKSVRNWCKISTLLETPAQILPSNTDKKTRETAGAELVKARDNHASSNWLDPFLVVPSQPICR